MSSERRQEVGIRQLYVILGPTAVGKTAVGLRVAERIGAEIISADSAAVYRGMDIGTAKPTPEERARVPVHLIDVAEPDEPFTAAKFRELALQAIHDIQARGKPVLIVGGTGLYLRVLLHGFRLAPPSDPELRRYLQQQAQQQGLHTLYERLKQIDPQAAARIHPNDAMRILRALEVYGMTGKPISEWQSRAESELPALKFGLTMPRPLLYRRINERVDQMMAQGFLQEVQNLLSKGYNRELPALKGLGYRHLIAYLMGEVELDEAVRLWKRDTRRFAKRQMTWFRREPGVIWLDASAGAEATAQTIVQMIMEQGGQHNGKGD
ncbi:tRNA dimethylallyltransferase [bacterium HR15]|nr:tRNA dimethylallyltransferase [bacterium HR15]